MRVLTAAIVTAFLAQATSAAAVPILSITPANQTVVEGGTSSFDVTISGVDDLYAFQFDLGFDPTFVEITGVDEGPFLGTGGSTIFLPGAIDNVGGTVSFTAGTLSGPISGVNGGGILATISFKALAEGTSALNIFNIFLLDSSLSSIEFELSTGSIDVEPRIPEPSTMLLLGTGALALAARARRVRRR